MVTVLALQLKLVFFVHLFLTSWALHGGWLPLTYAYYNIFFPIILLWSIHHKESEEPVFMAMVLDAMSVLMDIIVLSVSYPSYTSSYQQFTMAIAIFNLILRLVSSLILFRVMNERGGEYNNFNVPNLGGYFGAPGPSGERGPYENIDQPVPQSVPSNHVDYSTDSYGKFQQP